MRQVLTHRLRFAPLADLIYATRNQRPLSVQYNVEFNVFVELWRFDVPFAPPNLLILLESLGSNPTLSAIFSTAYRPTNHNKSLQIRTALGMASRTTFEWACAISSVTTS